jgi:imidazolonepropionase
MSLLLTNIKELVHVEEVASKWKAGHDMKDIQILNEAYLLMKDGLIEDFGLMKDFSETLITDTDELLEVDCTGKCVFPSFCDSHTHIVYPKSREEEFVDKINGLSYEEIARRGGGILNSARAIQEMSEDELFESAVERVSEMIAMGTGAIEIKSGYGLNTESELKMLRVIKRLKAEMPVEIKATFLGAHSIPMEYRGKQSEYVDLVIDKMLPKVAEEQLADYVDVFCDQGFFTVEDTDRILEAAAQYGMRPKIHANELGLTGGIQVGVKYNALSVDHLEFVGEEEIAALKDSETMPTVLPGAAFFLEMKLSPVREMIEAGLPVALASDYNPGSSPSGNMKFIQSLGCIKYKMLPEEVIAATTTNTAYAMDLSATHGSIAKGKVANVFITREISGYKFMPYAYGSDLIDTVILKGQIVE